MTAHEKLMEELTAINLMPKAEVVEPKSDKSMSD